MTSKRSKKSPNPEVIPPVKPAGKKPKSRKPKPVADTSKISPSTVLDFLAKKHGGMNKVVTAYIRETAAKMVKDGVTFSELYNKAMMEGWDNVLSDMPVKAVLSIPAKPTTKGGGRNGNLAQLRDDIVNFLGAGPATAAQVSKEIGADRKRLTRQLSKLIEDGKVKATGSRRQRTYSLV